MRNWAAIATVAVSLTFTLAVAPSQQKHKPAPRPRPNATGTSGETRAASEGQKVYVADCQRCHGDGNSETKELNFADGEWRHGSSVEEVIHTVTDGVPGTAMLGWKDRLTEQQIAAVAKYVRSFDKTLAGRGKRGK